MKYWFIYRVLILFMVIILLICEEIEWKLLEKICILKEKMYLFSYGFCLFCFIEIMEWL